MKKLMVAMLMLTAPAHSQEARHSGLSIAVGSKVRLRVPAGRIEGTITEIAADSLKVSIEDDGMQNVSVSRQSITKLEVSTGRKRKALKGMLIGAAVGGAVGAYCETCSSAESHAAGAVGGAVSGLLIGALFHGERWSTVPLDRVRVSVWPARERGVGASLSLGW